MPENGDNSYKKHLLAKLERSHDNNLCCNGHPNVNVLKKKSPLTNNFTLQRSVPPKSKFSL